MLYGLMLYLNIFVCFCLKVLYRQDGHSTGTLYTTNKHFIELPLYKDGDYLVEVRAQSEGGDGAVAQVRIPGKLSVRTPALMCHMRSVCKVFTSLVLT